MRTKPCKVCGKPFKASPADYTVRCPECRARARTRTYGAAPITHTRDREPAAGATCTITVAADGTRCGKPAVTAFASRIDGHVYNECAEHAYR